MNRPFTLSPRHLLILALLAAAFLRFWRLDSLPPGLYHDEAYYALDALSLLEGKTFPIYYEGWELYAQDAHAERPATPTRFPIFFEGNYGREPIHVYLLALSIKLFGATPFAIRLVVAISGVLGVWTTYLAATALFGGRELVGTRGNSEELRGTQSSVLSPQSYLPSLAAFAMVILYQLLPCRACAMVARHFGRFGGWAGNCFGRGGAAERGGGAGGRGGDGGARGRGGGGTWRWYKPGTWNLKPETLWFIAAGFFLGLGLYSYAAARLLPLLFVVFVPLWFWRDRGAFQRYWRVVGVMALVAAATAAPLLLFFARYPYFFIFRTGYVANKGLGAVPGKPWLTWLGNIGRVFAGLFWQGEGHLRHNLPGRPYLDAIQAVLFLLGLGWLGRRGEGETRRQGEWLSDQALFLLIWLGVMLLPTILSGDAPHFGRMTGAAPVIAIIIAAGAVWLLELIGKTRFLPLSPQSSVLILFLLSTTITGYDYFVRYATHPQLAEFFYVDDWELGRYAAAQPANTVMYLTPTQEEMATIFYALEGQRERLHSYYAPDGALPLGRPGEPLLYLLRPGDEATLQRLQHEFPNGTVDETQPLFIPFHVPASTPRLQANNSADAVFGEQIRLVGWSQTEVEGQLLVDLYWKAEAEMERSYTAFVHVLNESGVLVAQLDRLPGGYPTSDWQPGEIIHDQYAIPIPEPFPSGTYTLETGFYYLPTLEPLGPAVQLGKWKAWRAW